MVSVARAKGDFALVTALQQRLGGVPVTRRLLLVAAAVAVVGLMATSALEETAAGGWFNVPWDGSGLGQPGNKASRRQDHLRSQTCRATTSASGVRTPRPADMVINPRSGPAGSHGPRARQGAKGRSFAPLSAYARGPIRLLRQGAVVGVNGHRAPTWSSLGRAPAPDG